MNRDARLSLIEQGELELAAAELQTAELERTTPDALAAVAADVAEGLVASEQAASRRDAANHALTEAREREDGLRRSLPELRQRLAQEDEQRRQRQLQKARDDARHAQQAATSAAKALGRPLREAITAARELERHRALADDAEAAVTALLTADDEPGAQEDEPILPEAAELIGLLAAGPRTPLADARRRQEEAAATHAKSDNDVLQWFRRNASERTIAQLEPHLHERARAILQQVEAERETARERIRAAQEERTYERI